MFREMLLEVGMVAPLRIIEQNQRVEVVAADVERLKGRYCCADATELAVAD